MPTAVTATDVTNVATELASETSTRIDLFIEISREYLCEDKWGTKAKTAIILYTAHLITLANRGATGAVGAVTSEKVGELSRNFGSAVGGQTDELAQTPYGMMLMQLRRGILFTPIVV
jgi:hypothetical protein